MFAIADQNAARDVDVAFQFQRGGIVDRNIVLARAMQATGPGRFGDVVMLAFGIDGEIAQHRGFDLRQIFAVGGVIDRSARKHETALQIHPAGLWRGQRVDRGFLGLDRSCSGQRWHCHQCGGAQNGGAGQPDGGG